MLSTKEKIIQKLDSFSESELSQLLEFANQLKQQESEDKFWGLKAQQAKTEGFIGIVESEALLKELLNIVNC
jgi:ornithine carbamoyltransferase